MAACLDSWAVLAWLDGVEPAASAIEDVFESTLPVMSWINLVEVEYRVARDHGAELAEQTLGELRRRLSAELPGVLRMREVAKLKAEFPIALADCFAVATAAGAKASLLTGDPEIVRREARLPCPVIDLR